MKPTQTSPKKKSTNEFIYVLELTGENYYIGRTKNIARRFLEHKSGEGSAWTKLHGNPKLIDLIPMVDEHSEDNLVIDYISRYGVDKVRGGSYVQINLPKFQIDSLKTQVKTTKNLCYFCSSPDHYILNCPQNQSTNTSTKFEPTELPKPLFYSKPQPIITVPTPIQTPSFFQNLFSFFGSTPIPTNPPIQEVKVIENSKIEDEKIVGTKNIPNTSKKYDKSIKCNRCGRLGHIIDSCYAKTHLNGTEL